MGRRLLEHLLAIVAGALLVVGAGCSGEGGEMGQSAAERGPRFDFFDGERVIPPWAWAEAPKPEADPGSALLLASLDIDEVVRKRVRSGSFADGIKTHPQWDPTANIIGDAEALLELGGWMSIPVEWGEIHREGGVEYRTSIVLPDGKKIPGTEIGLYFLTIRDLATEEELQAIEEEHRLSSALLSIEFNLYESDSAIGSERTRLLMLGSAWDAAFELGKGRARADGDIAAAELWEERQEELVEAMRFLHGEVLRRIENR